MIPVHLDQEGLGQVGSDARYTGSRYTESRYKRIVLKLSGEALQGSLSGGIDFPTLGQICDEVKEAHAMGVEIALVVGGGNIFRGKGAVESDIDKPTADYMGMLATVVNALALQAALEARDLPTRVLTAIEMPPVAEPYIRRRAVRHLEKGRVVIFGAGTGNPFFTTDTAAALRANEIGAEILMKATKVDGVYDKNPVGNPDAKRYDVLDYTTALTANLEVMDSTAIALCRDNALPILVFNLTQRGNIVKALQGELIGTMVKGE